MSNGRRRTILYGLAVLVAGALLFVGFGLTLPPDAGTRLNGASFIAGAGDFDKAIEICDQVIREHPDNNEARIFRATFLAMAERYDDALAAYDDALSRAKDEEMRRNLVLDRASVLLSAGRMEEFREERDRLARGGADYRYLLLEGLAAEKASDWDNAVLAYQRAHELKADEQVKARLFKALVAQGDQALVAAQYDKAREAFDRAIPLFPRVTDASLKAAEVRLAQQDIAGAVAILRPLGAGTRGVAPLVFRAATQYLDRGDREAALDALAGAFVADEEGTRVLFDTSPAWQRLRDDPEVQAILNAKQETAEPALTPHQ